MAALLITAVALILFFIYQKITGAYSYWQKKGIKGPKPEFPFGNIRKLWKKEESVITLFNQIYNDYPQEKVVGIYQGLTPTLLIRDPDLMKKVLVKDFSIFVNRGIQATKDPIARHLFALEGDDWKTMRQKLTPIFTVGKLKQMMPLMNSSVNKYMEYLDKLSNEKTPREIRKLTMKYTMKTITSVAFGLDVDTFVEELTTFEVMANKIFTPTGIRAYALIINNVWPGITDKLHIRVTSKEVSDFFLKLVKEIVDEREGKPKVRKDFMDLMIDLREQGKVTRVKDDGVTELEITHSLITAQAIVFYAAGFETSSGAMSFLLYELALNPEIQAKCHEEVDKIFKKYNNELDYDALKELHYVSMAFDESLRKYPVGAVLFRQAVSDYTFSDINLKINKGTKIVVPVLPLQKDPKYFVDPEKFDPERFSPENKESIHDFYMPFGEGPRNCIGLRFAKLQSMLGIAHFLHKFRVTPCEKTPKKITYDVKTVVLTSKDGIWLNFERRTENIVDKKVKT